MLTKSPVGGRCYRWAMGSGICGAPNQGRTPRRRVRCIARVAATRGRGFSASFAVWAAFAGLGWEYLAACNRCQDVCPEPLNVAAYCIQEGGCLLSGQPVPLCPRGGCGSLLEPASGVLTIPMGALCDQGLARRPPHLLLFGKCPLGSRRRSSERWRQSVRAGPRGRHPLPWMQLFSFEWFGSVHQSPCTCVYARPSVSRGSQRARDRAS